MRLSRTAACFTIAGVYLVLRLATPMVRPDHHFANLLVSTSIAVTMLVQFALVVNIAGLRISVRSTLQLALVSVVLFTGSLLLFRDLKHVGPISALGLAAVQDLFLMVAAGFLGCIAGMIIREKNILLPIAVFAGLVDYWSVSLGPLSGIIENKPSLISAVAVHMPTPVQGIPMVMIGVGDFVFLALFFSSMFRFGMNVKGAFLLGYVLLTASMFVVLIFGTPLPALLPMGLAIIVANAGHFKLKREEHLAMVYVGAILLAFLIVSGVFLFRK